MIFDDFLKNQFSTITSKAAVASFKFVGKKDKIGADKAAVDVMRNEINKLKIDGHIVIGEGELDEAPMLYIGEKVGTGDGMAIDIAVDPVEGTNFVANNLPGGLSLIAIAEKGKLLNAPETYMNKIAINNDIHAECVDLDYSIIKNINNIADFKKVKTSEITACLLDRPRHKNIINELKKLKVNLKLISDGDVSGALMVTDKKYNVDIFLGIGGGPEGVLAAVALDSYNCKFQGRFIFDNEKSRFRAKKMGIVDLEKKYELNELVKGESILFATGITNGELVSGVKLKKNEFITETLVTHKNFSNNIIINKIPNT
tara:strand:+ start:56 stop:1000 length:945 start_codon:yes stop_codon:yes gene_type:complete